MLRIARTEGIGEAEPLQTLALMGAQGETVSIRDGAGREYTRLAGAPDMTFTVGGALGTHTATAFDAGGQAKGSVSFTVTARTSVDDGGPFRELFDLLYKTMCVYSPDGTGSLVWRGRTFRYFVHWMLDHVHTAKGMQYFSPVAGELAELSALSQREDGLIWSFTVNDSGPGYFDTANGAFGYARRDDDTLFVRQPAENHCEYLFVNLIHMHWKATGDSAWAAGLLDVAMRALEYSVTDRSRWSEKFGLLKRAYTIDSWDFQVDDEYTPDLGTGSHMQIDPDQTKFGVFYGDNTGYAQACDELAEMLARVGRTEEADKYQTRGKEIRDRLDQLTWNGQFFTHHIEEDPGVHRDLGVDETTQVSLSHCYSVNRCLTHDQCKAIFETYLHRKANLPPQSPGEWYAIYPPFGKGFGGHNGLWKYMNGGVAGHAAGELARGALEHGYEAYGADILARLLDLGKTLGGRIWFSYTGAIPPPPPEPVFTPLPIAAQANMDITEEGGPDALPWIGVRDPGNDLKNLPVGAQTLAGVPYLIPDPATNNRRAAVGISLRSGFLAAAEVPIQAEAAAIYLLHTAANLGPEGIAGAVTFQYEDGASKTVYLVSGKHLGGWWFPELSTRDAGVAWHGPSPVSTSVGVYWASLANPHPEKAIKSLRFQASLDGAIYALLGVTLADRPHYVHPTPIALAGSDTGGPDNWAGGTAMLALMEGLAGVADTDTAYRHVRLSPRWTASGTESVGVTARYAASDGYVAYHYAHDTEMRQITLTLTGSGDTIDCHVLLPEGVSEAQAVIVDGQPAPFVTAHRENSAYADFTLTLPTVQTATVQY